MNISDMINEKLETSQEIKKTEERKKFVIFLDEETEYQLQALALATRTGKIEFATSIAKIGMNDAYIAALEKGVDFDKIMREDEIRRREKAIKAARMDEDDD